MSDKNDEEKNLRYKKEIIKLIYVIVFWLLLCIIEWSVFEPGCNAALAFITSFMFVTCICNM